jgi:hypothetical protein
MTYNPSATKPTGGHLFVGKPQNEFRVSGSQISCKATCP